MAAFLIDENLPTELAAVLRHRGHNAAHVHDLGMAGSPDDRVMDAAKARRAAVITEDLGFASLTTFPLGSHPGIVVLRFPRATLRQRVDRIVEALDHELALDLSGVLAIVSRSRVRIRRP